MRDYLSDEIVKEAVDRLPDYWGLSTVMEDGELYLSNPQVVVTTTETGLRGVVERHRPICPANDRHLFQGALENRIHCRRASALHLLNDARNQSATMRREAKEEARWHRRETFRKSAKDG